MKITFYSNYMNHHQFPFSRNMYERMGDNFKFVATSSIGAERLAFGYEDMNMKYPFIITAYNNADNKNYAMQLAMDSEVIIIGSAPDYYMSDRLKAGKLTFKYSERFFKQGLSLRQIPRAFVSAKQHLSKYQSYPLYFLCSSAYTAADVNRFSNYKNRTFKWGYFPEAKEYDIEELIKRKHSDVINILWCGRFIEWKHPEQAIIVAQRLDKENVNFQLKMIGNGEKLNIIKNMADNMRLKHPVQFLGSMSPEKVRKYMEEANIYLFTSDFNEGWGAVLNESMNSGCAIVASHAIGSVPFLLKHGVNGLIYKNDDIDDLSKKVLFLAKHKGICEKLGKNAYWTIKNTWNASIGAERFVKLSENLLEGYVYEYKDGPCSRAKIIKNNWFNEGD